MTSAGEISECAVVASNGESGFSLVEVVIALLLLMIATVGVFAAFTYSTMYNSGNSQRSQALSVLQREVELLRSLKFNPPPAVVDSALAGGIKSPRNVVAADGITYVVETTIDDDPFTGGVQVDPAKTIKEITLTVTPLGTRNTWIAAKRTRVIFRRVRSN